MTETSEITTYAYTAYGDLIPDSPTPNTFGYNAGFVAYKRHMEAGGTAVILYNSSSIFTNAGHYVAYVGRQGGENLLVDPHSGNAKRRWTKPGYEDVDWYSDALTKQGAKKYYLISIN